MSEDEFYQADTEDIDSIEHNGLSRREAAKILLSMRNSRIDASVVKTSSERHQKRELPHNIDDADSNLERQDKSDEPPKKKQHRPEVKYHDVSTSRDGRSLSGRSFPMRLSASRPRNSLEFDSTPSFLESASASTPKARIEARNTPEPKIKTRLRNTPATEQQRKERKEARDNQPRVSVQVHHTPPQVILQLRYKLRPQQKMAIIPKSVDSDEDLKDEYIRCICGVEDSDDELAMVCCDGCSAWQHNVCMGLSEDEEKLPDKYFCEMCNSQDHEETVQALKHGRKIWLKRQANH